VVRYHKPSNWQTPELWGEVPEIDRARVAACTTGSRFEEILAAANLPDSLVQPEEYARLVEIIKRGVGAIAMSWGIWLYLDTRPTSAQRLTALQKVETACEVVTDAIAALDGDSRSILERALPSSIPLAPPSAPQLSASTPLDYRVANVRAFLDQVAVAARRAIIESENAQKNAARHAEVWAPAPGENAVADDTFIYLGPSVPMPSVMDALIMSTRDDEPAKRKLVRQVAGIWETIGRTPTITKAVDSATARVKGNVSGRFAIFAVAIAQAVEQADAQVRGPMQPIGPLDSELDLVTREYRRLAKLRETGK